MSDYHAALHKCGIRYDDMMKAKLENCVSLSLLDDRKIEMDKELRVFIALFLSGCIDGFPVTKLCRWLGFIQGVLIERGYTTVEAERDWTRPLFRPLDFPED